MLLQRVVTALVLLFLMLGALMSSRSWPFALLSLVLITAAAWEWGRLNQAPALLSWAMGAVVAVAGVAAWQAHWASPGEAGASRWWWAMAVLWVLGSAVALRNGPAAWPQLPRLARWVLGVVALFAAWLALVQAHALGVNFMLSVLALVWAADIAAYFGGRRFGRRKLAPSISPGKSWEGVWSGVVGVLLLALLWVALDSAYGFDGPSLYTRLVQHLGWAGTLPLLLLLSAMSVVGDLVESLVKRAAGAKDSSRLLPGHGGVLDRVDALLPVLPLAMAMLSL
jgi:phosphatidate cytidylyltransferase